VRLYRSGDSSFRRRAPRVGASPRLMRGRPRSGPAVTPTAPCTRSTQGQCTRPPRCPRTATLVGAPASATTSGQFPAWTPANCSSSISAPPRFCTECPSAIPDPDGEPRSMPGPGPHRRRTDDARAVQSRSGLETHTGSNPLDHLCWRAGLPDPRRRHARRTRPEDIVSTTYVSRATRITTATRFWSPMDLVTSTTGPIPPTFTPSTVTAVPSGSC
jgi:hypothetical protein